MRHAVSVDRLVRGVRPSVVRLTSGRGAGTGTVLGRRGVLVTNAHVARGGPITVVTADGVRAEASIIAASRDCGRPGQIVLAIGYPGGNAVSVRAGVVASHQQSAARAGRTLVFSDLRLAPGFSGGPMVDAEGGLLRSAH